MPIIGLTHEKDGSPRMHRTVTCKVAIGLPPDSKSNYPKKLDHFVFLKQVKNGTELQWVVDEEKQEHYKADCKSFWVVFLSDDIGEVFRTELAAYVKTKCWCRGDGEKAQRRVQIGQEWPPKGDFAPHKGPCANGGCKDYEPKDSKPAACKPSADLYFMLSDFPTLGTICRIHTSSYQSIRQIHTALMDLQAVTAGRLMGVRAKLFVMPARNVFEQGGVEKTGTKYVLGLELAAKDIPQLMEAVAATAKQFQGLQKQLSGHVLEIEEDEAERAPEIAAEFYCDRSASQEDPEEPEAALKAQADELLQKLRPEWNQAKRAMEIGKRLGRMQEFVDSVKAALKTNKIPPTKSGDSGNQLPAASADRAASGEADRSTPEGRGPVTPSRSRALRTQPEPEKEPRESAAQPSGNIHGLEITDDDFPEGLFTDAPETKKPEPATPNTNGFDF